MSRDRIAAAGLAAPLALAAILVPFRASVPNTDGALALILVIVMVAAAGAELLATSSSVWFDCFLTVPDGAVHGDPAGGYRDADRPGRRAALCRRPARRPPLSPPLSPPPGCPLPAGNPGPLTY